MRRKVIYISLCLLILICSLIRVSSAQLTSTQSWPSSGSSFPLYAPAAPSFTTATFGTGGKLSTWGEGVSTRSGVGGTSTGYSSPLGGFGGVSSFSAVMSPLTVSGGVSSRMAGGVPVTSSQPAPQEPALFGEAGSYSSYAPGLGSNYSGLSSFSSYTPGLGAGYGNVSTDSVFGNYGLQISGGSGTQSFGNGAINPAYLASQCPLATHIIIPDKTPQGIIRPDIHHWELCKNCPPFPPWDLKTTAVTGTSISLRWMDYTEERSLGGTYLNSLEEAGFEVQRRLPEGSWEVVTILNPSPGGNKEVSYTDINLTPATQYCYRIRVWNDYGEAYSDEPKELCATTIAPPKPPRLYEGAYRGSDKIIMHIADENVSEERITLERWDKDSPDLKKIIKTWLGPIDWVEYEDTGLKPSTQYCYVVTAWQGGLSSEYSAQGGICINTLPTEPAEPTDLTIKDKGEAWITIGWKDNATDESYFNIISYRVVGAKRDSELITKLSSHSGTGPMKYKRSGLQSDTEYVFMVNACKCDSYSECNCSYQNDISATTLAHSSTTSATANVNLSLKVGPWTTPSTSGKCTGKISWTFRPKKLNAGSGKDKEFTISDDYEASETSCGTNEYGKSEYCCYYHQPVFGLRTGTWTIECASYPWSTSCEVELQSGSNLVNFSMNRYGCAQGLKFP